jgi:hypothetical protein
MTHAHRTGHRDADAGRGPGRRVRPAAASARRGSAIRSSGLPATAATTSPTTYGLALDYDRASGELDGTAVISARHAVSGALRPRPPRLRRQPLAGGRAPGDLPARGPGADRHPALGAVEGERLHRDRALRGRARDHHRPRRVDRGLGPDRRRRLRRGRAAGGAGMVPGQRQPAGQGHLRHGRHGSRRHHGAGQRRARRALLPPGARPGCGTRTTRWRPISRRRPTGASR